MRILIPAFLLCLHVSSLEHPAAFTATVCGPVCGYFLLARLAYHFHRQGIP